MADREVVVLDVVLDHVLPVDRDFVGPGLVERDHPVDPVVRKLLDVRGHALGDRGLAAAEADEDHPHEHFELDRLQAVLRAVEFREGVRGADAAVAAIEVVGPAVVHAGQELGAMAATACDHRVRAVGAHIMEGADLAVGPAHDEAAAAEELEGDIVARLGQLALVADDLPVRQKQVLALQLVELIAVVGPGRERQLDCGIAGDRGLRLLQARGRSGLDARREPGEHAAEVRAALPARGLAVEAIALEQDPLPLLVDESHETLGDRLGIRPGRGVARARR